MPTTHRFADRPALQSRFTGQECAEALDGIGRRALPCLLYWLTAKPGRVKPWVYQLLDHQRWIRFRFAGERDPQMLALDGFVYFGAEAQPLLPELIRLTHSPEANVRGLAFSAAFFTRPGTKRCSCPWLIAVCRKQTGAIRRWPRNGWWSGFQLRPSGPGCGARVPGNLSKFAAHECRFDGSSLKISAPISYPGAVFVLDWRMTADQRRFAPPRRNSLAG